MGRLDGKVALISGGARGQGAAEARMFASEGAKVVFGDILDEDGRKVEAEILELGGEATYVHLDVTQEEQWRSAVSTAVTKYGKLDVLVNNAGISLRGGIEDISEADWDRVMDVNIKGVFLGTKHSIPAMREAGAAPLSTSPPVLASLPLPAPRAHTPPARERCASSARRRLSSTPRTRYAATPSIPAPLTPRWSGGRGPTTPAGWMTWWAGSPWAGWAPRKRLPTGSYTWPQMSLPSLPGRSL